MSIIVGIILIPIGILMSVFNDQMYKTFGQVPFAEEYLRLQG